MILLIQPLGNKYDFLTIRIPNGLLHVAAPLVEDGYDVAIVDQKIDFDWKEKVTSYLNQGVTCVGVTCSTGNMISHALSVSKFVRETSPNVPIVWGGPHPSLLPEQTLETSEYIDIVVINEGDEIFHDLVKTLENKGDLKTVEGICFKDPKTHWLPQHQIEFQIYFVHG